MNVEQFLNNAPLESLLVAFFNAEIGLDGNFYIISTYRQASSKYANGIYLPADSYKDTAQKLSAKYGIPFYIANGTTVESKIINNLRFSQEQFMIKIYETILPKLSNYNGNFDLEMALAMFVLRGSADFTLGLYAVDIKKPNHNHSYINNLFKLLLSTDDLMSRLNLNFREFQPQYIKGTNIRNPQIRVNLKWYYDNVVLIENLNEYKTILLRKNVPNLGEVRSYNGFEDRLVFYRESVLGHKLTQPEINALRESLGFTQSEIIATPDNRFGIRNQKIVAYAREVFDDVCVGCGHKYNIEDRSFKMPRNNRYYFEVNHVIAYANDSKAVDVLDNLVKLCPTCHRALTPGRAHEELQKDIIRHELESRSEVKRFVLSMMPSNIHSPVDYVYSMLK